MVQTIQAKEVSLADLERIFGLQQVDNPQFFQEWQGDLPLLAEWQLSVCETS
jgi:hypothetical protein